MSNASTIMEEDSTIELYFYVFLNSAIGYAS